LDVLRITVSDQPRVLTFRLEGRLEGAWVAELEKCWRETRVRARRSKHRVDLSGVTYFDDAGIELLAHMYEQGAELAAGDCLTKALVEEIAVTRPPPQRDAG
jgi:anti-anti-sigma regulatory factor